MACTTILVGKKASYNGATLMARNDDSGSGHFMPKKWTVINPKDQPVMYKSVISHVEIELPSDPLRYTSMPNAVSGEGIWAAAGVNSANVSMTATETITSNERVLAADPLVLYNPSEYNDNDVYKLAMENTIKRKSEQSKNEHQESDSEGTPGGIGEEDLVAIVLPYINTAREGVIRLGKLLETYGTYEMNAVGFSDVNEIWWLESIGGHHWIARRVPDDSYVIMPNQFGIDEFDIADAFGEQNDFMCSDDLCEFMMKYHLQLEMDKDLDEMDGVFNPRLAFGSHDDSDHCYNTPRAWYMARYFNPDSYVWDGVDVDFTPESDDIPWSLIPEHKITSEDVKYILSSHYQGTPFDPYGRYGDHSENGKYRSIGINRTDFMGLMESRRDVPEPCCVIEWIAFASNAFNAMVPFYANVTKTPKYMNVTGGTVTTESFYWTSRMIAALADGADKHTGKALFAIETYQQDVQSKGRHIIEKTDDMLREKRSRLAVTKIMEKANEEIAEMLRAEANKVLKAVLDESSNNMKNQYSRSDA